MMGASYPSWSSDSKCVIFTASPTQKMLVYRACLSNRKPQQIADLSVAGSQVRGSFGAWTGIAPDGSILVLRNISSEEIYALHVKWP